MVGSTDWPLIHALTREVHVSRHSQRCPMAESRAGIERCTCWVLHQAKRTAEHVSALYAARERV